jgi:hypothetical protein
MSEFVRNARAIVRIIAHGNGPQLNGFSPEREKATLRSAASGSACQLLLRFEDDFSR